MFYFYPIPWNQYEQLESTQTEVLTKCIFFRKMEYESKENALIFNLKQRPMVNIAHLSNDGYDNIRFFKFS